MTSMDTQVRRRTRVRGPQGPRPEGGGRDARRLAAAILEVLAGARTPAEAAEALGMSAPRYYALEVRALEGLVAACEPAPKGRLRSGEGALEYHKQECEKLKRDCARYQALLRASQRTVGLSPPRPLAKAQGGKKRRKRKPVARALKAVVHLQSSLNGQEPSPSDGTRTAG